MNKRASNIEVKKVNRNRTFRFVNKFERVSKPEIASALGMSIPTVMQNVNELKEQGLVREVGEFKSTGGRKASAITSIKDRHYAIGFDVTKNHIGLVICDLSGDILFQKRFYRPYYNNQEYYNEVADLVLKFKKEHISSESTFLGFGISIPGIIDRKTEEIVYSHALGIQNIPCSVFTKYLSEPSFFINDANAAGFAEIYHNDMSINAVYLSLSDSVGGTIIQDRPMLLTDNPLSDKLYLGDNNRSSEFGHMALYPRGGNCYCGKKGCLDYYCSSKVLSGRAGNNLETFFVKLEEGDSNLRIVWEEYLDNLAFAINNIRMIFDCTVIIGGYVGSFIAPYMRQLRDKTSKLNTFEDDASYIVPCTYRVESSALGAALLKLEEFINSI